MSFVTFLAQGPKAFENLNVLKLCENPIITRNPDTRTEEEIRNSHQSFHFSLRAPHYYSLDRIRERRRVGILFSLDFESAVKANNTWRKFEELSQHLSYCSAAIAIGCFSWKYLKARTLFVRPHLLSVIGALSFGALAYVANLRKNQAACEQPPHLLSQKLTITPRDIDHFRHGMLDETEKGFHDLTERLKGSVKPRAGELLTDSEILYIVNKLPEANLPPTPDKVLSDSFPRTTFLHECFKFRQSIVVEEILRQRSNLYTHWVQKNILKSIKVFGLPDHFSEPQDETMSASFQACYNSQESNIPLQEKDIETARGKVFKTIAAKFKESPESATRYIQEQARKDFDKLLFTPIFQNRMSSIAQKMESFGEITPQTWLKKQFVALVDEEAKSILLGSF